MKQTYSKFHVFWLLTLFAMSVTRWAVAQDSVAQVMDAVVTRLYETMSLEQLYALDDAAAQAALKPEERQVFATKHWYFDVDVPVVVSVLRQIEQQIPPFWLAEAGFTKTDMLVKNMENWTYEVWQKPFPAGRVELGINGFDNFRPHYLVCVGPQDPGAKVTMSGFHPEGQAVVEMQQGALTYHDWTELVLTEVPEALRGQQLLPTTRGRAGEAALVGAFRKTEFPSSEKPGPLYLTWSGDPRTSQTIQWRTSTVVTGGVVHYRPKGSGGDFLNAKAVLASMEDRMLANDRYCHWFSANLEGLLPGTAYEYRAGNATLGAWGEGEFTTAPEAPQPFRFFFCSDTHSNAQWGKLLEETYGRFPDAAFCTISGDLVGTGMEREDWDDFLTFGEPMFRTRPVMPAIGNHDAQLGLPPSMYLQVFGLPEAGPAGLTPERAYTFRYSNTQFFVLDVMSDAGPQREWLRQELEKSEARWKIAVFHFPLYSREEAYPRLVEAWGTLFDQYHVDLVLTGHIHSHLRTRPMRAGQPVASPAEGTVYLTSVSIPTRPLRREKPDFAEVWLGGGLFCNVIDVSEDQLHVRAVTTGGEVKDEFTIKK